MKLIRMKFSSEYDLVLGRGLLPAIGDRLRSVLCDGNKVMVVTDKNVEVLYLAQVMSSLALSGFDAKYISLPADESAKSFECAMQIYEQLCAHGFSRGDCVMALGGGVVGDVTGFAASTYMRGIKLISVPTTLLADADSSIGGKNAVNTRFGKNTVGTVYHPAMTLMDVELLNTLEPREIASGMGEIIKTAAIGDPQLFKTLLYSTQNDYINMLERCIAVKSRFVSGDEGDVGLRRTLNFGHTFGHAIEAACGYAHSHGQCVAMGMLYACALGEYMDITPKYVSNALSTLLHKYMLPGFECSKHELDLSRKYILLDKKRACDGIDMVFLNEIGLSVVRRVSLDDIARLLPV